MTTGPKSPTVGSVLGLPGTTNLRSTGGYPTANGFVRDDALFRSDSLHAIGPAGVAQLRELGIVRVLDLRDAVELTLEPSALTGSEIEVIHHPVFGDGGLASIGSFGIDDVYRFVVERRADALADAMGLIAEAPAGGVLVHCTAGKDRTGLVAAIALSAVGVPREVVIADYAASERNLAGERADAILAVARDRFGELDEGAVELMVASPARAITHALNVIDTLYGGVERMLLDNGLAPSTLETLQSRLTA